MKRARIYMICACMAVLASLAALYLPEQQPDNAPAPQPTVSGSTVIPIPAASPEQLAGPSPVLYWRCAYEVVRSV